MTVIVYNSCGVPHSPWRTETEEEELGGYIQLSGSIFGLRSEQSMAWANRRGLNLTSVTYKVTKWTSGVTRAYKDGCDLQEHVHILVNKN